MSENFNTEDKTNPQKPADRRVATGEIPAIDERRAPPRRGGCGCWITALFALFIAAMLIVAGLFLPPVNLYDRLFGVQYVMLTADQNAYATADQSLIMVLNAEDPGTDFGVNIETVALNDFISGTGAEWVPAAQASVPPYLALQSGVYNVQSTGTAPDSLTLDMQIPSNVGTPDTLDAYGWYADSGRWKFLPSQLNTAGKLTVSVDDMPQRVALFQAAPLDPVVLTPIDITETLTDEVGRVATIVSPAGLQPNLNGSLVGSLAPGFDINAGYRVMPVIRNFADPLALDVSTIETILGNPALRAEHVRQITAVAANGGYDGVVIDYRDLPVAQRDNFSLLIEALAESFRDSNLLLGVMVPAAENQNGVWETGAYDWRAIGAHADYVVIGFNLDPKIFAAGEDRLVEAMLRWAKGEVSRYKLVAGLNALSSREINGAFSPIGFDTALAMLGDVTIEAEKSETGVVFPGAPILASLDGQDAVPGLDNEVFTPFVEYMNDDNSVASRVWLTTGSALRFRMDRVGIFAMGGIALDDLVARGLAEDILPTVMNYKLRVPVQTERQELGLRWRVADASGVISEVVTDLNEDLVLTLEPGQEGNFAVQVDIIGGRLSSARSSAQVQIAAPTNTPTPLPTSTPTPEPTATPTLEPIIPTSTSAPGNNSVGNFTAPVAGVGAGAIAGGFEYGGHVTSTSSDVAANAMRSAGMTWMKVQIRYAPGNDPGGVASVIAEGRARGFKVLLGVVGYPADLAAGGGAYIQQFASYLGGVAAQGPDAIEVWNEPNIDREWPTGQISGANYASMLSAAYSAIKASNPGVMVISGAPSPTGAEAAFPGAVMNDDRFIAEMFAAGAANSMDCLGLHYNEGIVGPSQQTGDPRDNFYSRYFWSMINTYWNASGGAKPICITETGYLTPEGYPGLGPYWAWAQNTTVAQQAAWLAESIALASTSGKVRLLIVWNIDFTAYDNNDPQGGYAIIRPNGDCPACRAIAGAR